MDIVSLIKDRLSETYSLHRRYVNPQLVRVVEVIGYNRNYTQVAGHGQDTVKILPPLVIDQTDADYFLTALDDVLKDAHKFPGSAWTTVKNLGLRTARTA
jgi:4-aminobutyrate aminotransferase-like enzyme